MAATTPTPAVPSFVDDFASAPAAPADKPAVTYTPSHAVRTDGATFLQGVKRDTDGVAFVAVWKGNADRLADGVKPRYHRADMVARYLQLLAVPAA